MGRYVNAKDDRTNRRLSSRRRQLTPSCLHCRAVQHVCWATTTRGSFQVGLLNCMHVHHHHRRRRCRCGEARDEVRVQQALSHRKVVYVVHGFYQEDIKKYASGCSCLCRALMTVGRDARIRGKARKGSSNTGRRR